MADVTQKASPAGSSCPAERSVIGNVDYRAVGLLPAKEAVEFAKSCGESFMAPELERDILKVPDTTLMEAANYHAISAMLLTRGLHKQGQAYRQTLEEELETRADKIRALEQELKALKKKAELAAPKAAEATAQKLRTDFDNYRNKKVDEKRKFAADAQKVANIYHELIQSVGEDTELPREAGIPEFMTWLSNELNAFGGHMAVGREYASMISLRAFAQFLVDNKCDHLDTGKIKDPNSYWKVSDEAHGVAKKFFNSFWRPGDVTSPCRALP